MPATDTSNDQLQQIRQGNVPADVLTHAGLGMAYAGRDWAKYKQDNHIDASTPMTPALLEKMKSIAHDSLRETPMSTDKPYDPQHPTILDAQINSYVERSLKMDADDRAHGINSPDGTHLQRYLDGTAAAVKDVDFGKIDQMDMAYIGSLKAKPNGAPSKFETIEAAINDAASKGISPDLKGKSFERDLIDTVKADDADPKGPHLFTNATPDETKPMSGGILQLIMMFIGALLGIDVSSLMGGAGQKTAADNGVSLKAEQDKLNSIKATAEQLRDDKGPDGKPLTEEQRKADVKALEEFAGISGDRMLTVAQMKELGGKTAADIDAVLAGKKSVGEVTTGIDSFTRDAGLGNLGHAATTGLGAAASTMLGLGPLPGMAASEHIAGFIQPAWDAVANFASSALPKLATTTNPHEGAGGSDPHQLRPDQGTSGPRTTVVTR